jgi:hypothetical protein
LKYHRFWCLYAAFFMAVLLVGLPGLAGAGLGWWAVWSFGWVFHSSCFVYHLFHWVKQ